MAIDFSGNSGTLLARLGKMGAVIANVSSHQAAQRTALATDLVAQLTADPDIQALVGQGYLGVLGAAGGGAGGLMSSVAGQAVSRAVFNDNPRPDQTLTTVSVLPSLREVIRQMKAQGVTVRACTVAASPTAFTGTGNAVLNAGLRRPYDGAALENAYAETLNVLCTRDSYAGGATAGNETLSFSGAGAVGDPYAWNWPGGSGVNGSTFSCIDGSKDLTGGNLLRNSGWDAFTADVPTYWLVVTGTAGSDFAQNTGVTYDGTSSLQLIGNGSTLTRIRQPFNSSSGTTTQLGSLTQYSFCGWLRRDGTAAGSGTLQVSLTDGSGAVINDAAGSANKLTVDLTALTTDWVAYKAMFRTPLILPSQVYLDLQLTAALTSGRSVYLDRFGMGNTKQLYASGPFVAAHSGSVPLTINDAAQVVITNSRGSGGTLNTWQTLLARLFFSEVYGNELLFPSAAGPTLSDSLIA